MSVPDSEWNAHQEAKMRPFGGGTRQNTPDPRDRIPTAGVLLFSLWKTRIEEGDFLIYIKGELAIGDSRVFGHPDWAVPNN